MDIKQYRKKKKLTQAAMANMLGVKQGTYSRYETRNAIPDKTVMLKISEITNGKVTANDFYGVV